MAEENLPEMFDADRAASEFLIYQTENGESRVQVRLFERSVWLTQRMIADLFQKSVKTVNEHIKNIFEEKELNPSATIWKFQIVRCAKRSLPKPKASSIRVAEYLTELPPREVLEKKPEGSGCDAQRAARRYAGGEMKETVPKGMWRMAGVGA